MNDGMTVFIRNSTFSNGALFISVDVNGYKKKPNKAGHDLFMFQINNKGNLVPMGTANTYYPSTSLCAEGSNSSENGFGCTAKALSDPNYFKNLH